ncbi:MAG TPA: DNA mismatch repair protein MutT, partial [Pseudomonas sp.]|nr:DNA mismatch repair protein MutT [Pseudomonas sp.]
MSRPFRGHARSHRVSIGLQACARPVGAGEPA